MCPALFKRDGNSWGREEGEGKIENECYEGNMERLEMI